MPLAAILGWLLTLGPLWALAVATTGDSQREAGFAIEIADAASGAVACPGRPQVREALGARMRNILDAGAARPDATVLSLTLSQVNADTVRLELRDRHGAIVLERLLGADRQAAALRPRDGACIALADTVGLIVERYLRQIGYRDPAALEPPPVPSRSAGPLPPSSSPPDPPAPPFALAPPALPPPPAPRAAPRLARRAYLGAGPRVSTPVPGWGGDSRWRGHIDIVGDLHVGRWALSASAGVGPSTQAAPIPLTDSGTLRIIPMPLRLGIGLRLPLGRRGTLIPGVAGGLDVLWTSTTRVDGPHPRAVIEPVVEAGAATLWPLGVHAYVRVHAASVFSLQPHDFVVEGQGEGTAPPVFRTARLYVRAGLDLGLAF